MGHMTSTKREMFRDISTYRYSRNRFAVFLTVMCAMTL